MDVVLFNESDTKLTPEEDQILIDVFGYSSGVFVGITLLPQVIKVLKTKSTKDLSHIFLVLSLIAAASKLIYGVLINQLPIVVTAPIIGIETLIIMIAKCVYDRRIDKKEIELSERGNEKEIVKKLKDLIIYDELEEEIKYKNEEVDICISIEKIIINAIEFEYKIGMIEDIINYISKKNGVCDALMPTEIAVK
jgi:MtN3 and saliva related transmembrane protein